MALLLAVSAYAAGPFVAGGSGSGTSLPSQTGNDGKYLTTDGTTAAWETVSTSLSGGAQYYLPVWTAADSLGKLAAAGSAGNPLISGGAAANPSWLAVVLAGGTNTFSMTNGTASLDVAAGAALNIDKSLQIATGAVVINGAAGGSSVLGLPNQTLNFGTMTNGKLCAYNSTGTVVDCNSDPSGGTPAAITVANEAADATSFPLFVTAATGDLEPKTNAAFTFDASNGTLGATKFAGAFNGTIGATTPAAGAFTTVTANSFTSNKSSGTAGDMGLYEANSTDTHAAGFRGPASITGDGAYRIQFPNARASAAGQVIAATNAGESGSGTAADPYVQTGSWITPATADSSTTFTEKTFDVDGTNNVLKTWDYIVLTHPHLCAAGAPMQTTNTANTFGQCKFGNATDKATNYAEYYLVVPPDIDTAVDLTATFKIKLGGADTGDHEYEITFDSVADSAAYAGSLSDAVSLAFTADASGADGDVETAGPTTLTGWRSAMTAGQLFVIRVARDGDHANDGSSVDSYSGPLIIKYKKTQ